MQPFNKNFLPLTPPAGGGGLGGISLHRLLLATVFITGACVLIIEVVAVRVLAPYFGNTIYAFSSVIGVILAALSLGYYLGGRLADKRASLIQFFHIILFSGLSVIILAGLIIYILPGIAYFFSLISGPPVISFLFFFLPGLLLGLLSPYVIKLLHESMPNRGIGTISGEVFFWGTLGSLTGTFLAGFYLVPTFGVKQIIIAVGLLLILLSLIPLSLHRERVGVRVFKKNLPLVILAALLLFGYYSFPVKSPGRIYQTEGLYQSIAIRDGLYNNRPARHLLQDLNLSGSIYLDDNTIASAYAHYYALHELSQPTIDSALVIGGGAYLVPRLLLENQPQANIITTEIEPGLDKIAEQYFALTAAPRHQNLVTDGRRFLHDTDQKFDLIFSDAYHSFYSIPAHLTTIEFFTLAKSKLNENGVFIANIAGSLAPTNQSFTLSELRTLQAVFANSYLFALESPRQAEPQNLIYLAINSDHRIDLSSPDLTNHASPIISTLAEKSVKLNNLPLNNHILLTDNYAPVDYLTAQLAEQITVR